MLTAVGRDCGRGTLVATSLQCSQTVAGVCGVGLGSERMQLASQQNRGRRSFEDHGAFEDSRDAREALVRSCAGGRVSEKGLSSRMYAIGRFYDDMMSGRLIADHAEG